jgi:transglutaminase-like putative cysteine protease
VNCQGYWYGIDPTNQLLVNDQYIKISHGRDSADCIVSLGIFRGAAKQQQTITVTVQEAEV